MLNEMKNQNYRFFYFILFYLSPVSNHAWTRLVIFRHTVSLFCRWRSITEFICLISHCKPENINLLGKSRALSDLFHWWRRWMVLVFLQFDWCFCCYTYCALVSLTYCLTRLKKKNNNWQRNSAINERRIMCDTKTNVSETPLWWSWNYDLKILPRHSHHRSYQPEGGLQPHHSSQSRHFLLTKWFSPSSSAAAAAAVDEWSISSRHRGKAVLTASLFGDCFSLIYIASVYSTSIFLGCISRNFRCLLH